uniref:DDE Tnp4 domain-containing protein n=1 Tax=Cajanus cajan TaxID=3821 RepID=A0A151QVD6_CAJCA|nr:hypothetical protein KK1_044834 [Cajanus cajan]
MFLHILSHNLKYRVMHFSSYRSKEIISRQFNNILRAVMKVSRDYLKFHTYLEGPSENKWRWFEKCAGALDETHILVTVSLKDRPKYRNRNGDITPQNFKELFNLRHSSARNAIKRYFGILKERWSILRTTSIFYIKIQIRIINDCFVLHNLIRDKQQIDQLLEVQDLELLSIVDEELTNQWRERVQNNVIDKVATI